MVKEAAPFNAMSSFKEDGAEAPEGVEVDPVAGQMVTPQDFIRIRESMSGGK